MINLKLFDFIGALHCLYRALACGVTMPQREPSVRLQLEGKNIISSQNILCSEVL